MSTNSSNEFQEIGNNKQSPKQISPAKRWSFTCNNYTEIILDKIVPKLKHFCSCAFFSKEVGESGTPHLQGYLEFNKKDRPLTIFPKDQFPIHWELSKGSKEQNLNYCTKDSPLAFTHGLPREIATIKNLYPFQKKILYLYEEQVSTQNDRSVLWFYGGTNIGKTAFIKYMLVHYNCILGGSGKYSDIINLIFNQDMTKDRGVIFNLPLANQGKVSYSALEAIKDGLICNTKYEGGFKVFNSPPLIVMANYPPNDLSKLANDRWKIYKIDNDEVILQDNDDIDHIYLDSDADE